MSMGEAEVASSECTHPTLCDLDGQNETSVVELGVERQRDESELAQRFTSRVELGDGREGRRRKLDHPESNLVVTSLGVPGPLNGIEHNGDQTVVDEVQPVQTASDAAYVEPDIAALDAEPPPQQAKKQRALPFDGVLLEPLEAVATRVSSSSGAQEILRLPVDGRTSDPGSALPANVQLPPIAAPEPEPGPCSSPLGMPSSGTSSGTATNLDELLQLIRGHPDSDAAVAAALSAVQRLKRAAPSSSAGSQPGGAAKRAATHAAHADALAAQLVQLGAQLPLLADSPNEEVASGVDRTNTSVEPALSDAAASDMPAPSGKQQAFTLGADEHPTSTGGRTGQVQSTGGGGQHGEGKLKKARSKASADPAGPAGAQSTSASAAPSTFPPTSTTAQEVQVKGGMDNATPSATTSTIPDMATYLNEYPMCKRLVEIVRSTPNNSTKTPLALVNEYAARLTLEVVWGEDADTPAGPYTATCTLRGRSGTADHAQGSGRGRNKRDARQVAAAACVEVLLGPTHGVTLMDFAAPLRPPTASVRVRDAAKPGLGYQGTSTTNATANKFGSKKRRDEDILNSPRQPSISGGSQGGGSGGIRPVAFTRGHQQTHQQQQPAPPQQVNSSSMPVTHGRREPEPMYREKPLTAAGVSIGGSRSFATTQQQRWRVGGRMSPAHPAHMGGGGAAPDHTSWQQSRPPMNPYNPSAAFNGADMGSGTRTGYHAGSRGMSHDAASSSFGMHSLQAILPAASDVIAGLHKRDNTAMLNSGGGGMEGALGALQAGLTGGPLDLSGLHGTLDALHSAAQVLPTNTWQDAAARAGITMPDYAAAAMAAASAAAKLSQWTGSQSTQSYNLPSSYQQQQPQHQSQHQSYSPPLLGADRQGGQSADGGYHTSGNASHIHAGYGSSTSGYGSNAGMRDSSLLGGTGGLGTGLTNTNNNGTYGGVGGIGPGGGTGGASGNNLPNASDQVASGGWSPWSLWGPSGTGGGQPASWAGDGQ